MPVRVLVVDDSGFFRRRIIEILSSDPRLDVVGEAKNGIEAIEKTKELEPDIVTMDIEMPTMDGITAVRKIMQQNPVPILMFSSLTTEGAQATLDALEAGALDYLPKRLEEISGNREEALRLLRSKVFIIGAKGKSAKLSRNKPTASTLSRASISSTQTKPTPISTQKSTAQIERGNFELLAIGTSTGGPLALQEVLSKLGENFSAPIVLIQHMPGTFTPAFASRLDQLCQIRVKQAEDGEVLENGCAYLAPGGMQMEIKQKAGRLYCQIAEGDSSLNYRPSVDVTLGSISEILSDKVLAVILTGMGSDGREGVRKLKAGGATIWAQDEASCVVYGMPAAVVEAGLTDRVLPLSEVGESIAQGFS
ncbi:MAG: chemotaxis response regulator protein-glutamate methylesterase [Gammaproteobacteria bacterium]|nr:chemotaxis response regulator protein-glutamate methylesterase [Gammaproteobacteria bacterium]